MAGERILIVEDERAVARGLEYALQQEGFSVLLAENGAQALELARNKAPRLMLLDLRLPDLSGFEVCRQLRAEGARLPILMVTARDEVVDRVVGLELGADDYIVKPYDLRELVARIHAHLRRVYGDLGQPGAPDKLTFGEVVIDQERLQVTRRGRQVNLTPTEFRLLRCLASHPGKPIPRQALIESVWDYAGDLGSQRTIDAHIRHLREKLEDDPAAPQWILTVRGLGYKLRAAE